MEDSRGRICEAMLELVSRKGFEDTGIDEVVELAGVDRAEFESHFGGKEDCAIAVFDQFLSDFAQTACAAYETESAWPASLRVAAYAAADWMVEHPREVHFGTVEMLWVGEVAQAKREAGFQIFAAMFDGGREKAPDPSVVPEFAAEGVVGSIAEMMTKRLQRGPIKDPYEFIPELMYLAVRPYLGEEAARRELTLPPHRRGTTNG